MKTCIKCDRKILEPTLPPEEPERCAFCGDDYPGCECDSGLIPGVDFPAGEDENAVQRCDLCQRFDSDEAAAEKLLSVAQSMGLLHEGYKVFTEPGEDVYIVHDETGLRTDLTTLYAQMTERRMGPEEQRAPAASEHNVLEELCETIEVTGGIEVDEEGNYCPIGDPEWIDLGNVYMKACRVLERTPKITAVADDTED